MLILFNFINEKQRINLEQYICKQIKNMQRHGKWKPSILIFF